MLYSSIRMSSQTPYHQINNSKKRDPSANEQYKTEAPQLGVNISFDYILEESLENYIDVTRNGYEDKQTNGIQVPTLIVHESPAQIDQQYSQNYRMQGRFLKKHYNQQRSLTPRRLEELLNLDMKKNEKKLNDIQMNKEQSNIIWEGSDEALFCHNLKISKRTSYQCKLQNNFYGSTHQNYINFSPHLWHNLDDEVSLSESMKKQRPPLMQHSELNYESTSSYFPEPNTFRFSDYDFIVNREPQNKRNIEKQLAFQESSILDIQKKNQHLEAESILEDLEGLKKIEQKNPQKKNKKAFCIRADSSSEEDNQSEKIMKISHKIQESSNVQMSIYIENCAKVDLQPINQNIDEGKSLSEMQSQTSSPYQSNLEDYNSQSIQQFQNILASERSKSTELIKKTEIHFENIISNLSIEYNEELKAKDKRISELSIDCFEYEQKIRELQIKVVKMSLSSEKAKGQQKLLESISESVNLMKEAPASFHHQIFPHHFEQPKDHSQHNEKMNICIEFLEQSQAQYFDAETYLRQYCQQLEELAFNSERQLQKNIETIKILQDCLELAIQELTIKEQKQKFMEELIINSNKQNQQLQEEIEQLKQKMLFMEANRQKQDEIEIEKRRQKLTDKSGENKQRKGIKI